MTGTLTKADEIDRLRAFADEVSEYPYLGPLVREAAGPIIDAIRNDFLVSGVAELWTEKRKLEADLAADRMKATAEVEALRQKARELARQVERATADLAEIRRVACRLAAAC